MVRLLGSDNDHEALGAVRALGRILHAAGASFHDLAAAISEEPAEPLGYGDEFWQPPKPKRGNNDFVPPKRMKRPPKPSGPPIWEMLETKGRLAWLSAVMRSEKIDIEQKIVAGALHAQTFSQPHTKIRPAHRTGINGIFATAWLQDVRPIADVLPGDPRLPLIWTGQNRDPVKRVMKAAEPYLPRADAIFARSIVKRIEAGPQTLAMPSVDEVEWIDRLLVAAYDLGARP